jgi:hypothetical protein
MHLCRFDHERFPIQQKGILARFECSGLIAGTSRQQQDCQQQSQ